MEAAQGSRRDRIRGQLADLKMPGALEALDAVLSGVDGGKPTPAEAIEALLGAQIQLRNNRRLQAAMRSSRLPAVKTLAVITSLEEAQAGGRLTHRLKTLTFPPVLVVDEIGYLPISSTGAMLFYQLMARRYERASTVLTSNKSFEEWGEVFGDDVMAGALIDRLLHHCHIVSIRGNSCRMRQHIELWNTLHSQAQEAETPAPKRTRKRREPPTS